MLKKIGIIACLVCFGLLIQAPSYGLWFKKQTNTPAAAAFAPINEDDGNRIWVGTFQIVFNDLVDYVLRAPLEFTDGPSPLAEAMNKKGFSVDMLSKNSYYKKYGKTTLALKDEIEKGIEKQFGEKSDILNNVNWNSKDLLIYAMLKKDFKFLKEFKDIGLGLFEGVGVKYFGIPKEGHNDLRKNVDVLFYNSENDYAVKLRTKENEEVILYRTDDDVSFEQYFKDLNQKTAEFEGDKEFQTGDMLRIPYIDFDKMYTYSEFEGRVIKNSKYVIGSAMQTVKFKMDNKGGTLKSEAALIMRMSLRPIEAERDFSFNKPFVLFIKEHDKEIPYFIVNFKNANLFEKA